MTRNTFAGTSCKIIGPLSTLEQVLSLILMFLLIIIICPCCYFRDFIEQHYVTLKKANPELPILIRECSGVQPMLWGRYGKKTTQLNHIHTNGHIYITIHLSASGFGKEHSVSLDNMNADQVAKALETIANAKP